MIILIIITLINQIQSSFCIHIFPPPEYTLRNYSQPLVTTIISAQQYEYKTGAPNYHLEVTKIYNNPPIT